MHRNGTNGAETHRTDELTEMECSGSSQANRGKLQDSQLRLLLLPLSLLHGWTFIHSLSLFLPILLRLFLQLSSLHSVTPLPCSWALADPTASVAATHMVIIPVATALPWMTARPSRCNDC